MGVHNVIRAFLPLNVNVMRAHFCVLCLEDLLCIDHTICLTLHNEQKNILLITDGNLKTALVL